MIFRENVPGFGDQPFPTLPVIRDLAEFAGYGYGALRTAVSRYRKSGELSSFVDETGTTRFRLSPAYRSVSEVVRTWQDRPEGFIIGVFSFRKDQEASRHLVRETLRYFGFKRIAQNTYINGMIDTAGLEAEMAKAGVAENFYIFRCPTINDPSLVSRLKAVFNLDERARHLTEFLAELRIFLREPGIDAMELGRRVFYAGPVHHMTSFVEEPPLPRSLFPAGYPLVELRSYLAEVIASRAGEVIGYYRTLCGM